jgi:membrane protein required for colicin V production
MAIADIIILAVIGLSLLFGGFRGLVKEALALGFWIAAAVLASVFNVRAAGLFAGLISNPAVQRIAAFIVIFVVTVFTGGLISNLISRLTTAAGLGGVDRGLGALFGIVRGVVIVTLVVMLTAQFEITRVWYGESRLVPYALVLAEYFQNLLAAAGVGEA